LLFGNVIHFDEKESQNSLLVAHVQQEYLPFHHRIASHKGNILVQKRHFHRHNIGQFDDFGLEFLIKQGFRLLQHRVQNRVVV